MTAATDEGRWAEAQSLMDSRPTEAAEQRLARWRRGRLLFVLGLTAAGVAVGLVVILLAGGRGTAARTEPPLWQEVTGAVVSGMGCVLALVGLVAVLRGNKRLRVWRNPLAPLTPAAAAAAPGTGSRPYRGPGGPAPAGSSYRRTPGEPAAPLGHPVVDVRPVVGHVDRRPRLVAAGGGCRVRPTGVRRGFLGPARRPSGATLPRVLPGARRGRVSRVGRSPGRPPGRCGSATARLRPDAGRAADGHCRPGVDQRS